MESLNLQVVAVLMPLEMNYHSIPHLKALTQIIEDTSRHVLGSSFKQHCTVLKNFILLHKRTKQRFHVTVAVYSL